MLNLLPQIDLSDDAIVAQLFGSGAWQDVMEPLRAEDMQVGEGGAWRLGQQEAGPAGEIQRARGWASKMG